MSPPLPRRRLLVSFAIACASACAFAAPALAKEHQVSIQNIKYEPKEIKVKKGDTVVWTNNDDKDHTVVSDDGSFSGSLKPGKSYSYTFRKAGNYSYSCRLHPRMKGSVSVD